MVGILKAAEKLIKIGIFLAFTLMIVAVTVQIFGRTFMAQPPIWTEEMSRIALLYVLGLGVGASVLTGDLVNVDLVLMHMPPPLRRACDLLSAALVSIFGFMLVPASWEFTELGAMQTSSVLVNLTMDYVFVTMTFFSVLLGLFGLIKFIELLVGVKETEFTSHNASEV